MLGQKLQIPLKTHPLRLGLVKHPFFGKIATADLSQAQVAVFLGQWWHPLHYFPEFLARLITVAKTVEVKTAISKILYQELGEGDASRAHEVSYLQTMKPLGYREEELSGAAPLPATERLVSTYAESSANLLAGLGALYGTEVADLAMVSGIGTAVRRQTGVKRLPWVDIHVEQEPEHVVRANDAIAPGFSEAEEAAILEGAEAIWSHWIAFFDELDSTVFPSGMSSAAS